MKKAIRYLRFSSDDQSHHSIERQDLATGTWAKSNDVAIVDTFEDKGYSARTFDRPDVKLLFEFIRKNYRQIDYLLVSELTRFSRETGDAINMVKKIQTTYNIRIVSAGRGQVYDIHDSNSFLMMGLEFLLGNTENIKRASDINGGIYTAKAIKGKWIQGGAAPFGYRKEGTGDHRRLVVFEEEAAVIRFIFNSYLRQVPIYVIREEARQMGLRHRGASAIQQILTNPLYMSFQQVKPWRDQPGGLFPIKDLSPIVDPDTWHRVQQEFEGPKQKKTLAEELPLRGMLRCSCSARLTGAPSTNKFGKPYLYYKCKNGGHLNLSASRAHEQLQGILQLLSLPEYMLEAIQEEVEIEQKEIGRESRRRLEMARREMEKIESDIYAVEKKFISEGSISVETYHRWHQDLSTRRVEVAANIEKYSRDEEQARWMDAQTLEQLTNLQGLYNDHGVAEKQELLRLVFDDSLYYSGRVYRTPFIMDTFSHNLLELKSNNLLILDGADYPMDGSPVRWRRASQNRTLHDFLSFLASIKAA
jgi:site-specific DNA recombinase